MTTLHKLAIQGIRAYDSNDKPAVIKFLHPITIIVGNNGSGKTTIIEALKYITSGVLPPSSQAGKSFVNDPKVTGQSIVKAKIMLSFHTATRQQIVATKCFQVEQKRVKASFKVTDSSISTCGADGTEAVMTHKCADMNRLMTHLFGVSKAIIENVIFCHQEEANWPLSDDRTLKNKFDDIFAATKYTKGIELVKTMKKSYSAKIKDASHTVNLVSNDMEVVVRLRKDFAKHNGAMEERLAEKEKLSAEIATISSRLAYCEARNSELSAMDAELVGLQRTKKVKEEELDKCKERMNSIFDDDLKDLEEFLKNLEENQKSLHSEKERIQREEDEVSSVIEVCSADVRDAERSVWKFESLKEEILAKEADISRLNRKFTELSGREISTKIQFRRFLDKKKAKFQSKVSEFGEEIQKCSNSVRNLYISKSDSSGKCKGISFQNSQLNSQQNSLERQKLKLQKSLSELEKRSKNTNFSALRQNVQKLTAKLSELKTDTAAEISAHEFEIAQNDRTRLELGNSLEKLRQNQNLSVQISLSQQRHVELSAQFDSAYSALKPSLVALLHDLPPTNALLPAVADVLSAAKTECSALKDRRRVLNETLLKTTGKAEDLSRSQTRLREQMRSDSLRLEGRDVPAELAEKRALLLQKQRAYQYTSATTVMFNKFNEYASEHSECSVCNRSLSRRELKEFLETNTHRMQQVKEQNLVNSLLREMQRVEGEIAALESQVTVFEKNDRNQKEFDSNEKEIRSLGDKCAALRAEMQPIDAEFAENEARCVAAQEMLHSVEKLLEVQKSMNNTEREVQHLKNKFSQSSALEMTEEELCEEGRRLEVENEALRAKIKQLQIALFDFQEKVSAAQENLSRCKQSSSESEVLRSQIENCERQIAEKSKNFVENEALISSIQNELNAIEDKIEALESQKSELEDSLRQFEREEKGPIQMYEKEFDVYEMRSAELEEMQRRLLTFGDVHEEVRAKRAKKLQAEQRKTELTAKLRDLNELIIRKESDQQDVAANIDHAYRTQDLQTLDAKISDLERAIERLVEREGNVRGEIAELVEKKSKRLERFARIEGSLEMENQRLHELELLLESEKYANIDEKYKKAVTKQRVMCAAVKTLERYYSVLDTALMAFHSMKMTQVNTVLRKLWQGTYKGRDIDTIAIRSDHATDSSKKQYNYCVVMVSGDMELPMRGRCSAGQRVLACILIRIALAETFCVQCGVMALDEPTTNLDRKNIHSLALALGTLINRRKAQKSFQLIIITHDEQFVESLNARELYVSGLRELTHSVDYYYLVSKNIKQFSTIKQQPL